MAKKALIVRGGWDGHQPEQVAHLFELALQRDGFDVELSDTLKIFEDDAKLAGLDLIVPHWTMGEITGPQEKGVTTAVRNGCGLAGCHGGMGDAFRKACDFQFMTGGQFVAHPGNDGTDYVVKIVKGSSPIVDGITDFTVKSEQYYMHVDPAITVLATTQFPVAPGPHEPNGDVAMPVVWTKRYGKGRVFYNSLGHSAAIVESEPCLTLMRRGFAWAAR